MTSQDPEDEKSLGHMDDTAEAAQESSTTDGPAAAGDYDPAQGSPGQDHPVGEDFPAEAVRYDDPDHRGRVDEQGRPQRPGPPPGRRAALRRGPARAGLRGPTLAA